METLITKFLEWIWDVGERYIFPWVIVREYEAGVVLLFGKYHFTLKRGLNFKFPLIHESLTCLIRPETLEVKPITIQIKNQETVSIGLVGVYVVEDEQRFLLEANDSATNIYHHLIMVASDYISDCTMEELVQKTTPYTKMKNKLNEEIKYLGVRFNTIGYSSICKTRPISLFNS
jgi:regulator of protease activity HflC (stomatin/prohibitin superfamily)